MITDHVYFLAGINPDAAETLRENIMGKIFSLRTMPERFPFLDIEDGESGYRKMLVSRWYLVLYKVEDDTVYVDYVLDGRSDYRILLD